MRTVHVSRGPGETIPVQIKDDAHLAELVQRFGAQSVVDIETGKPAQPAGEPAAPEPKAAAKKARSKASPQHPAKKSGSKKRK